MSQEIIITLSILSFVVLIIPTVWEVQDDSQGDFNKKEDVYYRALMGFAVSLVGLLPHTEGTFWFCVWVVSRGFILSMAMHFFVFDYWIAYRLGHYKDWFSYLGQKGKIDNIPFWRGLNPWLRLVVRSVVLIVALVLYFFV